MCGWGQGGGGGVSGGRTHLPKFKIFGKISHRFTRDFTNTDQKIKKCLICCVKKYFDLESIGAQPWNPLEIIVNEFMFMTNTVYTVRCMQRSRKWVLPNWIGLYLPPLVVCVVVVGLWVSWGLYEGHWLWEWVCWGRGGVDVCLWVWVGSWVSFWTSGIVYMLILTMSTVCFKLNLAKKWTEWVLEKTLFKHYYRYY